MDYHDNEALEACVLAAAERAGARGRLEVAGETVEGRALRTVTVAAPGRAPDAARAQALVLGNIHGAEVIGSEVALAILDLLCAEAPVGHAAALLDLADVTTLCAINLDARARALAGARGLVGGAPRGNARGVDLNRNFPFPPDAKDPWHPLAGTHRRWLPWYRGPAALSEPESQALVALCDRLRPRAACNLHSVGRLFLYPYCYTDAAPPDLEAFLAMGEAFRAAQPDGVRYTVKQSRTWYGILGDLDDWLYDTHGSLSFTVELSVPLAGVGWNPLRLLNQFAWMNPRSPAGPIANAAEACLAALAEGCRRRSGVA